MEDIIMEETNETVEQPTNMIDNATVAAERLEKANTERSALLDREEAIMARRALGGQSEAGAKAPEVKPMSDLEYAQAITRGEISPFGDDGTK